MKLRSLVAVLLVLCLFPFSGAGAQDNITLGVVMPFTGALGSFGSDFFRGVELAVAQMNAELEAAGPATRFVTTSVDTEGTPDGSARAVEAVSDLFPLVAKRRDKPASQLSGGERQMLAIAIGWLSGPSLMLLDEPSAGLPPIWSTMCSRPCCH